MAVELLAVALAGALVVVQVLLAAVPKALASPRWAAGPRDAPPPALPERAKRAERARANLMETFPVFAAGAIAVVVAGVSSTATETAAVVWLVARVLYLPAYVFHVPLLRAAIWAVALAALGVILGVVVLAAAREGGAIPA